MAYQMIHLELAYQLINKLNIIANPSEYILGSVVPDSVHMNPNFKIESKIHSHLFEDCGPWGDTQDYERWLSNITSFYKSIPNTQEYNISPDRVTDFALGVVVHCLTDYCNDLFLWRRMQKANIPPLDPVCFKESYYVEARGIDQYLYMHSPNKMQIKKLLEAGQSYEFGDLFNSEDIILMKDHLINRQYAQASSIDISEYHFLSPQILEAFMEESKEFIVNFLFSELLQ